MRSQPFGWLFASLPRHKTRGIPTYFSAPRSLPVAHSLLRTARRSSLKARRIFRFGFYPPE